MSVDHYENFPVASWLCPAPLRPAVRAIYHYARCADDIADEGDAPPERRLDEMSRYRAALEATLRGEDAQPLPPAWSPVFRDLRDHILLCCTERNTGADVDAFVAALGESIR